VAHVEQTFQLVEREPFVHRERAHDAEAHALIDQAVEARVFARLRRTRYGNWLGSGCALRACRWGRALGGGGFSRHDSVVRSAVRKPGAGRRNPTRAAPSAKRKVSRTRRRRERRTSRPWMR